MVPIISTTESNAQPAYFFLRGVIKGFERETKGGEGKGKKKKRILGTAGKECFYKHSQFSVQTFERIDWSKQTHPDTAETAELGAVGAQAGIPQLLHTNKTSEHLGNALHRGLAPLLNMLQTLQGCICLPGTEPGFSPVPNISEGDTTWTPQASPSASPALLQHLFYNSALLLQGTVPVWLISLGAGLSAAKIFLCVFTGGWAAVRRNGVVPADSGPALNCS